MEGGRFEVGDVLCCCVVMSMIIVGGGEGWSEGGGEGRDVFGG